MGRHMAEESTPLSDILESDTTEQQDAAPSQEQGEPDGPPRDDKGRFAAKESGVEQPQDSPADTGPPPDKLPQEEYGVVRAVRDENKTLKAEMESLRQQLQTLQQPKEPPAPPPSIWEDEQGWQQHFGSQVAQHASLNARLDMSEMLASQAHEDFDAMRTKFLAMAEANPALAQQAMAERHPWEKAYQIAKNASTMEELGATDLATLKAKMREELLAEMQANPPAQQQLPPTLTTERNVGNRSGPAWTGPKSLDELLG